MKLRNIFFWVVNFILPKNLNSLIIYSAQRLEIFDNLERLTETLKIWVIKTKFHLCNTVQKTNTSEKFNQNIIEIIIKYLWKTVGFENSLL